MIRTMKTLVLLSVGLAIAASLRASDSTAPAGRIDVNRASESELMTLPGVNRETARRIIARRPFANQAKFLDVLQLPPEVLQRVAARIVVGGVPPPTVPPPLTKTAPRKASSSPSRAIPAPAVTHPAFPTNRPPLPPAQRIDINTAAIEELERAGGLDEPSARLIIANRPYRSLSELSKAGYLHDRIVELSHYFRVAPQK